MILTNVANSRNKLITETYPRPQLDKKEESGDHRLRAQILISIST